MNYFLIDNDHRFGLKLSLNEYCLLYLIDGLSKKGKSDLKFRWCYASRMTLAKRIGISSRWTYKLLDELIQKGFIEKHPNKRYLRTTEKWKSQGNIVRSKRMNKDRRGSEQSAAADSEFPSPNNNINNKIEKKLKVNTPEYNLSQLLYNLIRQRNPKHKRPSLNKWAVSIDKLIKLDGRTPEEIELVINWCQNDQFWRNNILSTDKLRQKYDQLFLKMNSERWNEDNGKTKTDISQKKDSFSRLNYQFDPGEAERRLQELKELEQNRD